jgi:DNA-binding SARP family transcriptional activator
MAEVYALGPIRVRVASGELKGVRTKLRELLALLLASYPHPTSATQLASDLWEGSPPPSARKVLQKYVSELRTLLGAETIASGPHGYRLTRTAVDIEEFRRLCVSARAFSPIDAINTAARIDSLWRGEPLEDASSSFCLNPIREELAAQRMALLDRCDEARIEFGHAAELVASLEQRALENPTREQTASLLIRALYLSGRQVEALRTHATYVSIRRNSGLGPPSSRFLELERMMLCHQAEDVRFQSTSNVGGLNHPTENTALVAAELDLARIRDPEDISRIVVDFESELRAAFTPAAFHVIASLGTRILAAIIDDPTTADDRFIADVGRVLQRAFECRLAFCQLTGPFDTTSTDALSQSVVDRVLHVLESAPWHSIAVQRIDASTSEPIGLTRVIWIGTEPPVPPERH